MATRVGIGLIHRAGCYLIRVRPPGGPMPGVWEFPGGKCLPGETPQDATVRECYEETGLVVQARRTRAILTHHYPHGEVVLHYFQCELVQSDDEPASDTGFLWVPVPALVQLTFPPANEAILRQLAQELESPPNP